MFIPPQESNDVEAVREIALLQSYSDARDRLAALEQVQWDRTRDDIAAWNEVKNKHTKIKSDGVDIDKERDRLDITNRVRRRLELPDVDSNGQLVSSNDIGFLGFTGTVRKDITW